MAIRVKGNVPLLLCAFHHAPCSFAQRKPCSHPRRCVRYRNPECVGKWDWAKQINLPSDAAAQQLRLRDVVVFGRVICRIFAFVWLFCVEFFVVTSRVNFVGEFIRISLIGVNRQMTNASNRMHIIYNYNALHSAYALVIWHRCPKRRALLTVLLCFPHSFIWYSFRNILLVAACT